MKKDTILRNTCVLVLLTLILGTILGFVQHITAEPIAVQEQLKKEQANKAVFADAESFENIDLEATGLSANIADAIAQAGLDSQSVSEVNAAKDASGNLLGYVITVATKGYGGDIDFVTGITTDGTMNGISYLEITETAGLGMRATSDEFKGQFAGKQVQEFTLTKTGATADDQIDALSGATVTSTAMMRGANAALAAFRVLTEEGGV